MGAGKGWDGGSRPGVHLLMFVFSLLCLVFCSVSALGVSALSRGRDRLVEPQGAVCLFFVLFRFDRATGVGVRERFGRVCVP